MDLRDGFARNQGDWMGRVNNGKGTKRRKTVEAIWTAKTGWLLCIVVHISGAPQARPRSHSRLILHRNEIARALQIESRALRAHLGRILHQ
jgi:hypothetical protein